MMPVAGWATGLAFIYKDPDSSLITSFLQREAQKPSEQVKEREGESDVGLPTQIITSGFTLMFLSENNKAVSNIVLI